jgi:hypothetical protein
MWTRITIIYLIAVFFLLPYVFNMWFLIFWFIGYLITMIFLIMLNPMQAMACMLGYSLGCGFAWPLIWAYLLWDHKK